MYSYGKQTISDGDIEAVIDVLKSDWLTQGPHIAAFEQALCDRFGCSHATAVSNGTAALHLVSLGLGWQAGDVVLTSPITFLASANCVAYAGATPGFADINPTDYTLDPEKLEQEIIRRQKAGERVKAVIAVDFAGHPCNWPALRKIADRYDLQLVADACHAIGAKIDGEELCASTYVDAMVLSFHPVKHMTTGEGGAILTNQAGVDKAVKMLRTHGMTKDPELLEQNEGPWYYEMQALGFNYRLTDFQAALGSRQLARLDAFISKRNEIARFYDEVFADDDRFITPAVRSNVLHAYHLYALQINFDQVEIDRAGLFARLREHNIAAQVHYIPVHLQPYYRKQYGFKDGDFPVAEAFYAREISLPIYPRLEAKDLRYIAQTFQNLVR